VDTGDRNLLACELDEDRRLGRARLRAALARPEIREAIFLAAPSLDESIEKWERDPESERGRRVERSLFRYFLRMAGRATPFGLFAGSSVGTIAERTELRLVSRPEYLRHTRLDMDYVVRLVEALERDRSVRPFLLYRPNPCLYRAAGKLRYIEARFEDGKRRHELATIEPTAYLEASLVCAWPPVWPSTVSRSSKPNPTCTS
jgi:hypothetical protein